MLELLFKDSLESLEELLNTLPKYQRKECKHCESKLFCAGECEKTIKGVANNGVYNNYIFLL